MVLFRTVYGPELPAIHTLLVECGATSRSNLLRWFVQTAVTGTEGANFDEAVSFLLATGLASVSVESPDYLAAKPTGNFRLSLLQRLQLVSTSGEETGHPLDAWFMGILNHCFVRPNRLFVPRMHSTVNALQLPVPCSEEKVNAWRRVMEYLGCGYRVVSGFMACYRTDLLLDVCKRWRNEGPVEEFLHHSEGFFPVFTEKGEMSLAILQPLLQLERGGHIRLSARGDYPGRSFIGERRLKWMTVEG